MKVVAEVEAPTDSGSSFDHNNDDDELTKFAEALRLLAGRMHLIPPAAVAGAATASAAAVEAWNLKRTFIQIITQQVIV